MQERQWKYFDVDLSIKADPSLQFSQVPPKLIAEAKAGAPATYDLIYQTDGTIAPLFQEDLLEQPDWVGLFNWIKKEDVFHDGRALVVSSMPTLPEYNTKLISKAEAPKKWMDLADPKWKGKMIAPSAQTVMVRLAQPDILGEEKAAELVKKLATQEMAFGRYPDIHTRLVAGEFTLATSQVYPYLQEDLPPRYELSFRQYGSHRQAVQ